jgi:hypothetical protein
MLNIFSLIESYWSWLSPSIVGTIASVVGIAGGLSQLFGGGGGTTGPLQGNITYDPFASQRGMYQGLLGQISPALTGVGMAGNLWNMAQGVGAPLNQPAPSPYGGLATAIPGGGMMPNVGPLGTGGMFRDIGNFLNRTFGGGQQMAGGGGPIATTMPVGGGGTLWGGGGSPMGGLPFAAPPTPGGYFPISPAPQPGPIPGAPTAGGYATIPGAPQVGAGPNFGAIMPQVTGAIQQDPGYQFVRQQALDAIQRGAAAQGSGVSGNVLYNMGNYASGLASTEFGNMFNRLYQVAQGQEAQRLGTFGAQLQSAGYGRDVQQQLYNQALQSAGYGREAQAQLFGQGLAAGQYGLSAQQQLYNQALSSGQFGLNEEIARMQAATSAAGLYNQTQEQNMALLAYLSGAGVTPPTLGQAGAYGAGGLYGITQGITNPAAIWNKSSLPPGFTPFNPATEVG